MLENLEDLKNASFAILGALEFVYLVNVSL